RDPAPVFRPRLFPLPVGHEPRSPTRSRTSGPRGGPIRPRMGTPTSPACRRGAQGTLPPPHSPCSTRSEGFGDLWPADPQHQHNAEVAPPPPAPRDAAPGRGARPTALLRRRRPPEPSPPRRRTRPARGRVRTPGPPPVAGSPRSGLPLRVDLQGDGQGQAHPGVVQFQAGVLGHLAEPVADGVGVHV